MIATPYPFIFIGSIAVMVIGMFGLLRHRNPIRMLLSLEVSFNGVLLLLLYMGWVLSSPLAGSSMALFAIGVSSSELALMVSIMMAMFKEGYLKILDQEELKEVEES
ncbi:MAG: NADH-quinone oxidoreductase subunit K [TACK group archaeon]|nr:NADH-quinone oxidoreductase subunit K [TACK group archaeon]